jgi:hypothetical protein
MVRNVYVDGIDCREVYGVWVAGGGYDDLFRFPAMKEPKFNDWPERDGIQVDLKAPKLQPPEASIRFVASRPGADVAGFVGLFAEPGYRAMQFPTLGRTFNLRLSEQSENRIYGEHVTDFVLLLIMDVPVRPATAMPSPGVRIVQSAYLLDGVNLAGYGIFVEKGRDSLTRTASVKQNLTRNISVLDGQLYDTGTVHLNSKEITLRCCLKAASPVELWGCRDALFASLIAPGEHELTYKGTVYPVYYRSMTACRLAALREGFAMIEFDLNMTVIR